MSWKFWYLQSILFDHVAWITENFKNSFRDIIYHSEVCWMSWGKILEWFWNDWDEIPYFIKAKGREVSELTNSLWLNDLSFLVDITRHLNCLNGKLQGKNQLVHSLYAHIKAFQSKLQLWHDQLLANLVIPRSFPALSTRNQADVDCGKYRHGLKNLIKEFQPCFTVFREHKIDFRIFSTPFHVHPTATPVEFQMELIELQAEYDGQNPIDFYKNHPSEGLFPLLQKHALRMIMLFGTTYSCKQLFSKMKFTRPKTRNCLSDSHLEDILRIGTCDSEVDMEDLVRKKQQFQIFH